MKRVLWLSLTMLLTIGLVGCKSKEQKEAEDKAKSEALAKFKGKWKVAERFGDRDEDEEEVDLSKGGFYYVIDGDLMKDVYIDKNGKEDIFGRRKLSFVGDKEPKGVDLTYVDEKGDPIKSKTTKKGITGKRKTTTTTLKDVAVYKFEGDYLWLHISFDEKKRPTDFSEAKKGSSSYILKLQKVKEGEKEEPAKDKEPAKDPKKEPAKEPMKEPAKEPMKK